MPSAPTVDKSATRQALILYLLVSIAAFTVTRATGHPTVGPYVHLAVAVLFLMVSLRLARGQLEHFGLKLGGLLEPNADDPRHAGPLGLFDLARALWAALPLGLRELGFALLVAVLVFPPFAGAFSWWHGTTHAFELSLSDSFVSTILAQLLLVALPEEAFFRGYLQTRLQDGEAKRIRLLGASFGPRSLILQAALFAILHFIVDANPARLAVFFPGLLFGWLRAKRGGIGAAVFFHAACNVFAEVLSRSWL